MTENDAPVETLVTTVSKPLRAVRSTLTWVDRRLDEWVRGLSDSTLVAYGTVMLGMCLGAAVYLASALLPALVPVAAAQEGSGGGAAAEDIMCGTGAGDAITLIFGLLALLLLIVAAGRLAAGLNKKGSQRSDKKREGEEQLTGALYSFAGVFALTAFPLILEQLGLATISCVTFAPF